MLKSKAALLAACGSVFILAGCDGAGDADKAGAEAAVELAEYPQQVYWGDTHLHTDNSVDAFGFGTRLGPEEALKFARGDTVKSTTGQEAKLARPLDFLVISDHSDGLGATRRLYDAPRIAVQAMGDDTLLRWYDMMHESPEQSQRAIGELIAAVADGNTPEALNDTEENRENTKEIWTDHLETLERYYEPGKFTAFAGFEYTLMPEGNNLHRVVMFRDGFDRTNQVLPYPGMTTTPEQLWAYMDSYEETTGGKVLAIPHNSNLSNGLMFELTKSDGGPMDAAYARKRAQREPLVEVTQIKGDSESHPFLSPNDEFASFGDIGWEMGNLSMTHKKQNSMFAGEYVREALKRGLSIEQQLGVNPYQFGMIGSTDSHTSLATGDEDNFYGKHTGNEPTNKNRALEGQNLGTRQGRFGWHYLAGGYAAVWARANTRGAIFDAMMRREVYATTGPRMEVRFFGGFDWAEDIFDGEWVKSAYEKGVPMGGELTDKGKAPSFLVAALKDPEGAHLDRVQIVKGWVDANGTTQEKVFDVAWSDMDDRPISNGKVPAVGDTVDRGAATYTNDIGTPQLEAIWTDPEYQQGQNAFYYVRVLEIPTPRWTLYDAVRFGFDLPEDAMKDAVAQERAYTSPIWLGRNQRGG